MKKLLLVLLVSLLACPALASSPPSDDSIQELLTVTQSRKLLDESMSQLDTMMQQTMQQMIAGKDLTPEQETILNDLQVRTVALLKGELQWETFEPMVIDIYKKSFTQEEIDGMLTFYRSPAGQAVIVKMPVVMNHTMQALQGRMQSIFPRLQALQQETIAKLRESSTP